MTHATQTPVPLHDPVALRDPAARRDAGASRDPDASTPPRPAPTGLGRILRAERISCLSHLAGAVAAVGGTAVLLLLARDTTRAWTALIYGLGMTAMFTASALYHAFKDEEDGRSLWRRLDHLAIFVMIAGSYTPVCAVHLQGAWRASILGTLWGLTLAGAVFKLWLIRTPRWVTAGIYVAMGWMAVVPMGQLLASVEPTAMGLLFAGGVAYTLGALGYALRRPNPVPGLFGFHEIFHLFVLAGAALHYGAIFRIVT